MTTQNTTQKNRFSKFQSCSEFSLNFHAQKNSIERIDYSSRLGAKNSVTVL